MTAERLAAKPVPTPTPATRRYWESAAEGVFLLPRCRDCDRFHHHPRRWYPYCWSTELDWDSPSGRGTVVTYSVVHQAPSPGFTVPYVLAVVRLDEGPQMMCNLVEVDPDEVRCELPVEITFEPRDELAVPQFRPNRST